MGIMILGWMMIIVGIFSTLAGIIGAIVKMMKDLVHNNKSKGLPTPEITINFMKALKDLIEALIKTPIWLTLVIIGFILIAWGGSLIK